MEEKIPCIMYNPQLWEYIKPYLKEWEYKIYDFASIKLYCLIVINFEDNLGHVANTSFNNLRNYNRELVTNVEEFLERAAKLKGFTYKRKDMEEKEVKIQIPEGYEIDKENSTFECIKFKKKSISYEEILSTVFNKDKNNSKNKIIHGFECTTFNEKLRDKINAIYKLMIVAKYLNDGWVPDFKDIGVYKYCLGVSNNGEICVDFHMSAFIGIVYFKSEELAQQAVKILGEETIKQALSNDY